MRFKRFSWLLAGGLALASSVSPSLIHSARAADAKPKAVYTDPKDPALPIDFQIQGEYAGENIGVQVIALGSGNFQAVVFPGGLPGAGWDGKQKSLLDGKVDGKLANFTAVASGAKKKYLAQSPAEFSATSTNPPAGQKNYSAAIDGETLTLKGEDDKLMTLKKKNRTSPTMGAKAPEGAIVLFDGSNKDAWKGGRVDKETKLLNTDGSDVVTTQKFNNYTMHIEFMLPYRPEGRGQGRGNSGFYQVDHYEVQILDSFGLDGKNNECGGVYTKLNPLVNMCLPPLAWQTYDVEFTNAVQDASGKKIKDARITLKHNGVVIHNDVAIVGPTGGHRMEPMGTPGIIKLQGHGNPVQFRNIWIVEKK